MRRRGLFRRKINTDVDISNLTSYYRLETDANDAVSDKHGTPTNVNFLNNEALFNGTSSHIILPELFSNLNQFSVTLLVEIDNSAALVEMRPLSLNNNTGGTYTSLRLQPGGEEGVIVGILSSTEGAKSTGNILKGKYSHVTFSLINNGAFKFYVNGVYINGWDQNFSQVNNTGQINNVLGASRTASSAFHYGKIRGVGIWNKAISDSEAYNISTKQLAGEQLI